MRPIGCVIIVKTRIATMPKNPNDRDDRKLDTLSAERAAEC